MNVQDTIRQSLWYYPSLYWNRTPVLEHLFYVIGNGYDWIDGELVIGERDFDEDDALTHGSSDIYEALDIMDKYTEVEARHRNRALAVRANINRLVFWVEPNFTPYPESKYSAINNLPEDIKPDWLSAAMEAKALHEDSPYDLNECISGRAEWPAGVTPIEYGDYYQLDDLRMYEVIESFKKEKT